MIKIQIIETIVVLSIYIILKILIYRYINTFVSTNIATKKKSKIAKKAINLITASVFLILILSIWGIDQSEILIFISSVLTVIGIALFAQWSILSNITSGVIIFLNHSVKLDDTITIIDKDYEIEGTISDIGLFFVHIKSQNNEQINIPNSIFLTKMIKKKSDA